MPIVTALALSMLLALAHRDRLRDLQRSFHREAEDG
jgi:hypothetical protein